MQEIKLNTIRLYGHHGCLAEEAKIGGHYEIDLVLYTDFSKAAETDELVDTIDYVEVHELVRQEMLQRSKLIEHVGQRILTRLKQTYAQLSKVRVEVTKICPPINGDVASVAVVLEA